MPMPRDSHIIIWTYRCTASDSCLDTCRDRSTINCTVDRWTTYSPGDENVISTITETIIGVLTKLGVVGLCLGWK